jgi:6,7-dimethyl-8-ribityllumazine synthase
MTEGPGQIGRYDPFEDTGDWPFRDAPPPPAEEPPMHESPLPESALEMRAVEESPHDEPEQSVLEPAAGDEEVVSALGVAPSAPADAVLAPIAEQAEEPAPPVAEPELVEPEAEPVAEHAAGELVVPEGPEVLTGAPHGFRRNVAVVVSRFNSDITNRLLDSAIGALRDCHVADDAITVVPVPGAFELPLAALALAKTRRYACVVAIGCVIRGETPHFDLIASEAASGLQLAAIETGIPVSFGVLTCETHEQAEARIDRAADAARAALEMADLFSQVRTRAAAAQ